MTTRYHLKPRVGSRLFFSVLALFFLFAIAFIAFQQHRERLYKVSLLELRLQDLNQQLDNVLQQKGTEGMADRLDDYLALHKVRGLRVTVIRKDGRVVYDNVRRQWTAMPNHARRPEVAQALRQGKGSTVERNSTTLNRDYFYSATYFPSHLYIIRCALPYDVDLVKSLSADQHYLWFALAIMLILTFVLYRFTRRLGNNITALNQFAARADQGDNIEATELGLFSNDEIGDTAARIVKLYLKLQRTSQEQEALKRQLTQNVAHELKTPVAAIQGYLETILENPNIDAATQKQFLSRSYAQSQRLTALLNDISTLNRLDDGAGMMGFEEVDVADIIRTVEQESLLTLGQKGMTMQCDIPEHIPIFGNHGLLYSIFRNLTDNAIAYAGRHKQVSISAWQKGGLWHFTFADNGVGVAPEHLPRLFERFYRVDKGRSRKMGGTGLGLAIVKNAVRVHGGTIVVSNNPAGGLRFDFTLKGKA